MGLYREESTRYSQDSHQRFIHTYRQPSWRHWASRALLALSMRTARWERWAERPLSWLHNLRCHDDCGGLMTSHRLKDQYRDPSVRPSVPSHRDDPEGEYWETIQQVSCGRLPFPVWVDLELYHFEEKDRVYLSTEEGPVIQKAAHSS